MTLYVHVVDSSSLVKGTLIKITHLNKGLLLEGLGCFNATVLTKC